MARMSFMLTGPDSVSEGVNWQPLFNQKNCGLKSDSLRLLKKRGVLACAASVELEFKGKTLVMVERGGRSV